MTWLQPVASLSLNGHQLRQVGKQGQAAGLWNERVVAGLLLLCHIQSGRCKYTKLSQHHVNHTDSEGTQLRQ